MNFKYIVAIIICCVYANEEDGKKEPQPIGKVLGGYYYENVRDPMKKGYKRFKRVTGIQKSDKVKEHDEGKEPNDAAK